MSAVETRESLAGAIGLQIAVLAVLLAIIAPMVMYAAWVPGLIAVVAGAWGLRSATKLRTPPSLSVATLTLGVLSIAVTGAWALVLWLVSSVFAECYENCS
jgi:hypothetical protein